MTVRDFWLRLRALLLRGRVEREMHEELDFHLEMQTRKHLAAGLGAVDARRLARAQFGSAALVEDRVRDARGIRLFETLFQVVRQSVRLASMGVIAGVVLALAAARLFAATVRMVDVFDSSAYVAGVGVVVAACLLAAWFPALRAARLNPMTTLRAD
jgi:putative ABC transport system permease protein